MKVRCILLQACLSGVLLLALASGAQPVITILPTNQTVVAGSTAIFSVTATDVGSLTYQWQLNGTNLPNNIILTVAGNGSTNYSGDGGVATNAGINEPAGVSFDAAGNLYIAEYLNNRIRKVDTNNIITTVAGNGIAGFAGDGGAATNARLNNPDGVTSDAAGNLYIADFLNNRIRFVNATNGIISTVAGNGQGGFVRDGFQATNYPYSSIFEPAGVALGNGGVWYIADEYNQRIRKVAANGIMTTVAGKGPSNPIQGSYSGDGGTAISAGLSDPNCVALDSAGNLYIADQLNNRIRKVDTNGIITTVAGTGAYGERGDGGAATNAALYYPQTVCFDAVGNYYIAEGNKIRMVDTNGIITTVAGKSDGLHGYSGDGGAATNAAFFGPESVTLDAIGNLYIADQANNRIRKVNFTGLQNYPLNNVSVANAGNYSVIVTGADGSVTSSVVALTVILPPQNFTASLGTAGLQLQFTGTTNYPYILQSATNLTPPVSWQPVLTNAADDNGNWSFTVTNTQVAPACFYRVSTQ
jgi:sugar lactone lactonase YvrE